MNRRCRSFSRSRVRVHSSLPLAHASAKEGWCRNECMTRMSEAPPWPEPRSPTESRGVACAPYPSVVSSSKPAAALPPLLSPCLDSLVDTGPQRTRVLTLDRGEPRGLPCRRPPRPVYGRALLYLSAKRTSHRRAGPRSSSARARRPLALRLPLPFRALRLKGSVLPLLRQGFPRLGTEEGACRDGSNAR